MTDVCFYFQVHQPVRLRRLHVFDMPDEPDYWDHEKNQRIMDRVADKCYIPTNQLILDLIKETDGAFRVAYSLSGTFIEQAQRFRPDVIDSFARLAKTGAVELLDETYYHSLTGLWEDQEEYREQIRAHRRLMKELFDVEPTTFRNTELIYDDRIARTISDLGYDAIMTEGTERVLGDRSPNHVYRPAGHEGEFKVLLKNYRMSDDVAFRFSNHDWKEFPLTAPKYADWLERAPGDTVNLFMDYETFGEHQWPETGIFDFLRHLPGETLQRRNLNFATPSEVVERHEARDTLEVPWAISWADSERDVSAWLHNRMQHECFNNLRELRSLVVEADDPALTHAWRLMTTSDHLYYCTTKFWGDQTVHAYFSPYDSPYEAYINYANAIDDLRGKLLVATGRR